MAVWARRILIEGGGRQARVRDARQQPREEVSWVDLPKIPAPQSTVQRCNDLTPAARKAGGAAQHCCSASRARGRACAPHRGKLAASARAAWQCQGTATGTVVDMPAVREDHAAAEDGDGHAAALVQLLQLHLARPLAAAIPARMAPLLLSLAINVTYVRMHCTVILKQCCTSWIMSASFTRLTTHSNTCRCDARIERRPAPRHLAPRTGHRLAHQAQLGRLTLGQLQANKEPHPSA